MDTDRHRCRTLGPGSGLTSQGKSRTVALSVSICVHLWFPSFSFLIQLISRNVMDTGVSPRRIE